MMIDTGRFRPELGSWSLFRGAWNVALIIIDELQLL